MGWEWRGPYGPYYTRTRRVGQRFVREYVGGGGRGAQAARADEAARSTRRIALETRMASINAVGGVAQDLHGLQVDVQTVVGDVLAAGGIREHKGEWRRCRR
jgi:hypothetical protein